MAEEEDWGDRGETTVTTKYHENIYDAIDPTKVQLPKPFTVCIVGASRGIGAGIAHNYAQAGASGIVLASRRISGLEEVARECKKLNPALETLVVSCDITSASSVEALAKQTKEKFGRLDVAVVNSGYSGPCVVTVTDTDPETFFQAANVNYVGTFYSAKYLIPLLLETEGGAKAFVGTNSTASLVVRGPIASSQYCVSKAAQLRLFEHIHEEFADQGLSAFAVHPGGVLTEMANEVVPEFLKEYFVDSPELGGAFCVWLTKEGNKRSWLSGRLLSAKWDVDELEAKKEQIVSKDLFKLTMNFS